MSTSAKIAALGTGIVVGTFLGTKSKRDVKRWILKFHLLFAIVFDLREWR